MIDKDGFDLHTCTGECGQTKIAPLFLPSEIGQPNPVCRACMGELTIRTRSPRIDTSTYQHTLRKRTTDRERRAQA